MKNFILAGLRCRTQEGKGSEEKRAHSHLSRLRLRACPIWDSDDTNSRDGYLGPADLLEIRY